MLKNSDLALKNYLAGYWTKGQLGALLWKNRITQEEYDHILAVAAAPEQAEAKADA